MAKSPASVSAYIAAQPEPARKVLNAVRKAIRSAIPKATEVISYQIPAYRLPGGGTVIYFAGWKHHVSLYPLPEADAALKHDMEPYVAAKGTLKFPLGKPIPYELIARVVKALARQRGHDATDA